jgi:hypothetical protein
MGRKIGPKRGREDGLSTSMAEGADAEDARGALGGVLADNTLIVVHGTVAYRTAKLGKI